MNWNKSCEFRDLHERKGSRGGEKRRPQDEGFFGARAFSLFHPDL
jgi:hypothetical protein